MIGLTCRICSSTSGEPATYANIQPNPKPLMRMCPSTARCVSARRYPSRSPDRAKLPLRCGADSVRPAHVASAATSPQTAMTPYIPRHSIAASNPTPIEGATIGATFATTVMAARRCCIALPSNRSDDRERYGHPRTRPNALHEARAEQHGDARRQCRNNPAHGEQCKAEQQRRLAATCIGKRAVDDRPDCKTRHEETQRQPGLTRARV